jgi:hypothetical protein
LVAVVSVFLQAYRQSGKPVEVLSEAERFVMSLMDVPRATPRLRAFALKFTAAEKAAEATAVFRVRRCGCAVLVWHVALCTACVCVKCFANLRRGAVNLLDVPRATPRLRAFALKFTAAEKAAEATAVFRRDFKHVAQW